MFAATKAREIADKVFDTTAIILSLLDTHIKQACQQGKYSLNYVAPMGTTESTLKTVREVLLKFGYGVTDWGKVLFGYEIEIHW